MKPKDLNIIKTKILNNSKSLIDESKLLYKKHFYSRSFTLSHLAVEELSKIPIVVSAISKLKSDKEFNYKNFIKSYSNHKFKILSSIVLLIADLADYKELDNIDLGIIKKETLLLDSLKNMSLYVHIEKDKITEPIEVIDKNVAKISIKKASYLYEFFIYAEKKKGKISSTDKDYVNIEKLASIEKNPEAMLGALKLLNKKFVELRTKKIIIN